MAREAVRGKIAQDLKEQTDRLVGLAWIATLALGLLIGGVVGGALLLIAMIAAIPVWVLMTHLHQKRKQQKRESQEK